MKTRFLLIAAPILAILVGSVHAQSASNCSCGAGARVDPDAAIATLLGGKTVCASLSANESWQEYHAGTTSAGGSLTDFKKGPNAPVDPSKVVGSWSTAGTGANARVIYNYGSGGTYQYEVCESGSSVRFCGARYGGRDITGTLLQGAVSCGF